MQRLLVIFAAASLSVNVHAKSSSADDAYGTGTTGTTTTTTTTTTTPTPGQTPFPTYVPPPAIAPTTKLPGMGGGSINPAANMGQQSQNNGSGSNAGAGAALIAAGAAMMAMPPTMPAGAALIAMGMLAMKQSDHDNGAAGQSGAAAAASFSGVGTNPADPANPALGKGNSAFSSPVVKDGLNTLKQAGYNVTPAGLVTPDGTTIPNSAFNSASGMKAAGMDEATVKAVQDALGKVNADMGSGPKVSAMAISEGGGGGTSADSKPGNDFSFKMQTSHYGLSDAAKKAMIAGKTVNFDGDPIGVRGNNIFDMIHVAYQKRRDSNDFIDPEASGPAVRAPASAAAKPLPAKPPAFKPVARPVINNR